MLHLISQDRVDEMLRQKTARPRSFSHAGQHFSSAIADRVGSILGRETRRVDKEKDEAVQPDNSGRPSGGGKSDIEAPSAREAAASETDLAPTLAHPPAPAAHAHPPPH